MAEETYRLLETTGYVGRGARARYSSRVDGWLAWEEWAALIYQVTPDRLMAATEASRAYWTVLRDQRWERIRKANPAFAARYGTAVQAMRKARTGGGKP